VVPPRNSLHSLRSCHSDTRGEPEVEAREYARGPRALRFSPPPMRPAGGPAHGALRGAVVVGVQWLGPVQTGWGRAALVL